MTNTLLSWPVTIIVLSITTLFTGVAQADILPPINDPQLNTERTTHSEKLFVRHYSVKGNTVLPETLLANAIQPYLNRYVDDYDLAQLQDSLTKLYIEQGYISSGARISSQSINNNMLTITIVEGTLDKVTIKNSGRLRDHYIESRLRHQMDEVINVDNMEEQLQLLKQNPRIKTLNSQLTPTKTLGKADLNISIEEQRPYSLYLSLNDHGSPSVGAEQISATFSHLNITGFGDSINIGAHKTRGKDAYFADYEWPLLSNGATVGLHWYEVEANVIEEPIDVLDIVSEYSSFSIDTRYPIYKNIHDQFDVSATLAYRKSDSFILKNIPFSFTDNVEDGEARVSVLRLGQRWTTRQQAFALLLDSTLSIGLSNLDNTRDERAGVDNEFIKWQGQLQIGKQLSWLNSQLFFNTRIQYSNTLLLGLEKFSIGGNSSVRGYRESAFLGDQGALASIEWRLPLYQRDAHHIDISTFIDGGYAHQKDKDFSNETLTSAGIGLHWQWLNNANATLYIAHGFTHTKPKDGVQDRGVHFSTSYTF